MQPNSRRRHHKRSQSKVECWVNGHQLPVRNWSIGGMSVVDRPNRIGTSIFIPMQMKLYILSFWLRFNILGMVAWREPVSCITGIRFPTRQGWNFVSDNPELQGELIRHLGPDATSR